MIKDQSEKWQEVEAILDRFEVAWQHGERPALETFLPTENGDGILAELCLVELELRLKAGQSARAEDYLKRYPALGEDRGTLLNLIATEYAWRWRHESDLRIEEYQRRFPLLEDAAFDRLRKTTPVPNVSVPGYEVLSSLGRGGMGVVYKARHLRLRRLVALKMVLAVHAEPKESAHLYREAEAIARLQHPNIVQVFEVGEREGQPYLAMEYVEGLSLAKYCSGKPIAPRLACELVQTMARAIHFAHQHGIIHRDLKPANILLARNDKLPACGYDPKITDFGLAKQMDGPPGVTQSGMVVGTPAYLAPEQAAGKNREVGAWTDTYALGTILYELVSGKPPFQGNNVMDTLQRVLTEEPTAPQGPTGSCSVPTDIQTICLKCLQKEPAKRYPSAEALADDLRRYLNNEPILARPISWWERGVKWSRRRPAAASLIGVILAAILTGIFGTVLHTVRLQEALEDAKRAQKEAENARRESQSRERQLRQYLYAADIRQAAQFWKTGDVKQARSRLLSYHPTHENTEDVRGFEWHYLWRLLHSSEKQTLCKDGREIDRAHFSADGRILALSDAKGTVALWNTDTGKLLTRVSAGPTNLAGLGLSQDGKTLAAANSLGTMYLYSVSTGQEHSKRSVFAAQVQALAIAPDLQRLALGYLDKPAELLGWSANKNAWAKISNEPVTALAFSPSGLLLATGSGQGVCHVRDGLTGKMRAYAQASFEIMSLAIRRQDDLVAVGCADGSILLWTHHTGTCVLLGRHLGPVRCLAFSADGQSLASGGDDTTVSWWNVPTRSKRFTFKGHTEPLLAVAFASDAVALLSVGRDGVVKRWQPAPDPEREQVPAAFWPSGVVAYSHDGKTLAFADRDGCVKLADADTGRVQTSLCGHVGTIHGLAFSPDGQVLASAGADHTCRLWSLPRSKPLAEAKELQCLNHDRPIGCVAISPTGKFLAYSGGGAVTLWDFEAGKVHARLTGHTGVIHGMDFANDQTLVTGCSGGMIKAWDVVTGKPRTISSAELAVRTVRCTRDGRHFATSHTHGVPKYWDLASGQTLADLGRLPGTVVSYMFSFDGKLLIAGMDTGHIAFWDTTKSKLIKLLNGLSGAVVSLSLAPDDNSLAIGFAGGVQLWDLSLMSYRTPAGQPPRVVRALAFSPDGRTLVTASDRASGPAGGSNPHSRARIFGPIFNHEQVAMEDAEDLQFWDVASRSKLARLEGQPSLGVVALSLGPNGRTLATGGRGGAVWLWDLNDHKLQRSMFISPQAQTYWWKWEAEKLAYGLLAIPSCPEFENVTWKIALSPGGSLLAAASELGTVKLWEVASGQERVTLGKSHQRYPDLVFSPDGKTLATSDAGEVHIWNTSTGKLDRTLPCHREAIRCLAFSPDGNLLATAGKDREIKLWDWRTGQRHGLLIGHHDTVVSLAFTPDGKTLASGSWDGTARLWHLLSGQELLVLEGHNGKVHSVAFSPDGKTLATGGESSGAGGEVYLWQGK